MFLVIGPTSFFETLFSSYVSACSWHCSFCSFDSRLLLGMLFSPAVGCAPLACCWLCSSRLLLAVLFSPAVGSVLLACCWLCSSRLLLAVPFSPAVGRALLMAVLFCHFITLSEILVDLLLVVLQDLRLCAPFRQSGFASFVDFFSSLALLAVMLPLFSVLWRRLLQHILCGSLLLRGLPQAPPTPLPSLRHFVIIGSR